MAADDVRRDATRDELEVAFSGPAPGVNRIILTLGATGVRLAFLEESENIPHFRAAVTMHPQDGLRLRDLLSRMLADIEKDIKRLKGGSASDGGHGGK